MYEQAFNLWRIGNRTYNDMCSYIHGHDLRADNSKLLRLDLPSLRCTTSAIVNH